MKRIRRFRDNLNKSQKLIISLWLVLSFAFSFNLMLDSLRRYRNIDLEEILILVFIIWPIICIVFFIPMVIFYTLWGSKGENKIS